MNKKLYRKQEKKIGKKFVLYQGLSKKKLGSKNRKEEFSSNFLNNNNARSNLDDSDTYTFVKKELGYLYVYLNKKN